VLLAAIAITDPQGRDATKVEKPDPVKKRPRKK
jgi:hypothetical protein